MHLVCLLRPCRFGVYITLIYILSFLDAGPIVIRTQEELSNVSNPILLEQIKCDGQEPDLLSCRRAQPLGLSRCSHKADVHLVCPGN